VTIPGGVTAIGPGAFYGCIGLTNATISSGVTSIGAAAFYACSGLTSVPIPSSVTNIGFWAFSACSGLNSVTIGNGVTSIGGGGFSGCTNLTSVTIPSNVTSIGGGLGRGIIGGAFAWCIGLTNATISSGVTSIGDAAFYACSGLTSVTIPSSVTNLGIWAFSNCSGLTSAYFQGDAPSTYGNSVFDNTTAQFSIYYPSTASGWSTPTWNGYPAQPYYQPVLSVVRGLGTLTPSFQGLLLGTNYQLQVSTDLSTWSNAGPMFTASNASEAYPQPFGVTKGDRLFFRLRSAPH